jgi:GNAT superfamily N-acetyltransferase
MGRLAHNLTLVGSSAPVVLRDRSTVRVRPVGSGDEPAMRAFLDGVSLDSLRRRFFGTPDLDRTASSLVAASGSEDFGLVAETDSSRAVVAHAAWFRILPNCAEVACLVTDGWQGRGLGTLLVSRLAALAERRGVTTLVAEVLPRNREMITVFQRTGYPVDVRWGGDVVEVRIDTSPRVPALARAA